jgi:hypothetical protein
LEHSEWRSGLFGPADNHLRIIRKLTSAGPKRLGRHSERSNVTDSSKCLLRIRLLKPLALRGDVVVSPLGRAYRATDSSM